MSDIIEKFLQAQNYHYNPTLPEVVWHKGAARLLHYPGSETTSILFIPSIINKSYIFDLSPHYSLIGDLPYNCYLLDFTDPTDLEFNFDDYITEYVLEAMRFIGAPMHLFGYCWGGNMAIAASSLSPELTKSLILLATPWLFNENDARLSQEMLALLPSSKGTIPKTAINSFFHWLFYKEILAKYQKFSLEDESWRKVEYWVQDGIDMPVPMARQLLYNFMYNNDLYYSRWQINGQIIKASCPSLLIYGSYDNIVPPASSLALPATQIEKIDTGHIGLLISQKKRELTKKVLMRHIENFTI